MEPRTSSSIAGRGIRGGAKVVCVDICTPIAPVQVEARYRDLLIVAFVGDSPVGEVFLEARPLVAPAEIWRALADQLAFDIWRAILRARLSAALGVDVGGKPCSVSVAVCTRDRPNELARCLRSLARLEPGPDEVLVVDNGSAGPATRDVCDVAGARYLREELPGQTRARNRALRDAEGDLVAFTDDDCQVDSRWLSGLHHSFADPLVMAVMGSVYPLELETNAQRIFERHGGFERHHRRRVFDLTGDRPLDAAAIAGAGANMVVRRAVPVHPGGFDEELGPGTPTRSSDDKYFVFRLLQAGYRVINEPERLVWHDHRRDEAALRQVMRDYGTSEFAYTTLCLARDGDPRALHIWRWWAGHYLAELARSQRQDPPVPMSVPLAELSGAVRGPWSLARSIRARRGVPALGAGSRSPAPRKTKTSTCGETSLGSERRSRRTPAPPPSELRSERLPPVRGPPRLDLAARSPARTRRS